MPLSLPPPDEVADIPALLQRLTGAGPWKGIGSLPGSGMTYQGITLIDCKHGFACSDGSGWTARVLVICDAQHQACHLSATVVYSDDDLDPESSWHIGFDLDRPEQHGGLYSDLFHRRAPGHVDVPGDAAVDGTIPPSQMAA